MKLYRYNETDETSIRLEGISIWKIQCNLYMCINWFCLFSSRYKPWMVLELKLPLQYTVNCYKLVGWSCISLPEMLQWRIPFICNLTLVGSESFPNWLNLRTHRIGTGNTVPIASFI